MNNENPFENLSKEEIEAGLMKVIRERIKQASLPYEPISDGFITTNEFCSMLGISTNTPRRRMARLLCAIRIGNNYEHSPAIIKECFAGQIPVVHVYEGKGAARHECRIAISDLDAEHAEAARKIVASRKNGAGDRMKRATAKKLEVLARHYNTVPGNVIELLINEKVAEVLSIDGRGGQENGLH